MITEKRKLTHYLVPGIIGLLVAVAAVYYFAFAGQAGGSAGGPAGIGGSGAFGRPAAVVSTARVTQGEIAAHADFVGALHGRSFAELYAKTQGQIIGIYAETGDFVRAGQLLAKIDDAEAQQAVAQAAAALRMAEATREQRRAALGVAEVNAGRTEQLHEKRLVSEQEQEAARADIASNLTQLQVAEAQVEQASANLSAAQVRLEETRVTAPFSGYIGRRFLDAGAFAATNRPVFTIVDHSTIRIAVSLSQRDAALISVGQPAVVRTDALPGETFEGRIARISPVFNPETNTADAEIEVYNANGMLRPGMFAAITVTYHTDATALLVPRRAVIETEQGTFVFLARRQQNGEAWEVRRLGVTVVGEGRDDHRQTVAIASDGVVAGDQVIILGHENLRDGSPIIVRDIGEMDQTPAEAPRLTSSATAH